MRTIRQQFQKGLLAVSLMWLMALLLLPMKVYAQSQMIADLEYSQDIVISMYYDKAEVAVTFTSPYGDTLAEEDFDKVERGTHTTYFYLKDAPSGEWKAEYDKGSNTTVEFTVVTWYQNLAVKDASCAATETDHYDVSFRVEAEEDLSYDYEIYAVTLDEQGNIDGQKELTGGWGYTGNDKTQNVNLENLPDGTYYLLVEAYATYSDGIEINDYAIIETAINVTGHNVDGDATLLKTVLDLDTSELLIDWSAIGEDYKTCLVAVYQGSAAEPVYFQELAKEEYGTEVALNFVSDEGDLRVVVTPQTGDDEYIQYVRDISWAVTSTIEITTAEKTGSSMLEMSYSMENDNTACEVEIGEAVQTYTLTGSGTFSVMLPENQLSEVHVRYATAPGMWYQRSKEISALNVPPILTLYGMEDEITVQSKEITISGCVDSTAKITVNGQEITPDENLDFTVTLPLSQGDNLLEFSAENEFGLASSRTLLVHYQKGGAGSAGSSNSGGTLRLLLLVLGLALGLLLIVALFGKIAQTSGKTGPGIILQMVTAALVVVALYFLAATIYCGLQYRNETLDITGSGLIRVLQEESYKSIEDALSRREFWKAVMIKSFLGTLLMSVAAILFGIMAHKAGKKRITLEPEAEVGTESAPEATDVPETEPALAPEETDVPEAEPALAPEETDVPETEPAPASEEAPRFCTNCGARVPAGSKFCEECGSLLE
ncbi:MAG: zinc-ribbon domain-containing protein [Lachnospiraceae bacterium]|nr:zinc-ribbon domain-containing protein [Lachnospiraceae bacterium]